MEIGHVGTRHVRVLCPPGVATKNLEAFQEEEFEKDVDTGSVLCDYSLSSVEIPRHVIGTPRDSDSDDTVSASRVRDGVAEMAEQFLSRSMMVGRTWDRQ